MRQPLLLIALSLAALFSADVLAQEQVQIQFVTDPVLVQTGVEIVFAVITVPDVFSMTWQYQGLTLGSWTGGNPSLNQVPQFEGRLTITSTQLRIAGAQLRDAGNYTVVVVPLAPTGLDSNSRSIQLRVFDAVLGVSLFVPSVAVEGRNLSLSCTWTSGTGTSVEWGKGGVAVLPDSRITISGGSLVINPARRGDAGEYTCTVSNPVSAQTVTQSLTVYYGPDTPVLTKDRPKECVGGGDVLAGQTVRLTCMSDSLPPALFSWTRDGQAVASGQPDSGVLSLQTFSSNESGRYVCTARNAITGGTSAQGTDLAVVDTCLNGGEVAGIVIGCFLLLLLLILLIVCLVLKCRAQQRQSETVVVRKTNVNPRPPDPQPNGARDLGQGLNPPLYHLNTHTRQPQNMYTVPRDGGGGGGGGDNRRTPRTSGSDTHRHNGRARSDRLLPSAAQNSHAFPQDGVDNPAFARADAPNVATTANQLQQNPNIVIQTGNAQGNTLPPEVRVSLNPQTAQQNNNAQMPTIHVSLNSYPPNGQQLQPANSFPLTNTLNNTSQTQETPVDAVQSTPRMQRGQAYPSNTHLNGLTDEGHEELIPTGYTHRNANNTPRLNANRSAHQSDPEPHGRSDRHSRRHDPDADSSARQMPWDLLRGTPAYPSGTPQRRQAPEVFSDTTDYTTDYTAHPPFHQARSPNRSQPRPQSQATSRGRDRERQRQDAQSEDRRDRSRSGDLRVPNGLRLPRLEPARRTQRSTQTQTEGAQQDIRGPPAPRHEAAHSGNPRALPLMSQPATASRSAAAQGPPTQQGAARPQGADTRALVDPNHLPQAHMAQPRGTALTHTSPQGLGTHTQPVMLGANGTRQVGTAPVQYPSSQPNPSNLTQEALAAHTRRAQTFDNRKQQTQAALLHPGTQAHAQGAAAARHPPPPPPVIPLAQFHTLPKERSQHRSPHRGTHPPRPPVNIPVAQRPHQAHTQHPSRAHTSHHHHPAHKHAHTQGHPGHPAHFTHPRQQQAHGGRPR